MPAHQIAYEIVKAGPDTDQIRSALNEIGRRGFHLHHTSIEESGVYTFILSKDTGLIAEEQEATGGEWIDDGFVNEETAWT